MDTAGRERAAMVAMPGPARRSREVLAFLEVLERTPVNGLTACRGWTVQDIVAHLTAGAVALADQAAAYLAGGPVPPFGSWAQRDARFRALDPAVLRARFDASEARMSRAFAALREKEPGAVIPGGGWSFPVEHLITHMRQEFALHRWDLVGDDRTSHDLLAQPEFLEHSVAFMDQWLLARGVATDESTGMPFRVRIRCPDGPDVLLERSPDRTGMRLVPPAGGGGPGGLVAADPAARLLLLWGRHPSDSRRLRSNLSADSLARVTTLLSGF